MKKIVIFEPKEVYHQGIFSILSKEGFILNSKNKAEETFLTDANLFILGFSQEHLELCLSISAKNNLPTLALLDDDCRLFFKKIVFKASPLSYFHRSSPVKIFLRAVNATINHQNFVDQKIAPWLTEIYNSGPEIKILTERELAVLKLVIAGHTNKKIAKELYISLPTVKFHLKNIFQKTKTSNRKQLISLYFNQTIK